MFETANGPALVVYTAREKFGPKTGEAWDNYLNWSKLHHVTEIISLDSMLCRDSIMELVDEDWEHNVHENFKGYLFWDLNYLLKRAQGGARLNFLAVIQEPAVDAGSLFCDSRFEFIGYDLIELETSVSALTNCGGFDRVFAPADLSTCGLLPDLKRAKKVQALLLECYPEEHHAHCDIWAIWRMNGLPN